MTTGNRATDYCSQTFVVLDKWLNQVGMEKGELSVKIVRSAMEKNIRSNITHYEELARGAERVGEQQLARKYRLLVKLYMGLLSPSR